MESRSKVETNLARQDIIAWPRRIQDDLVRAHRIVHGVDCWRWGHRSGVRRHLLSFRIQRQDRGVVVGEMVLDNVNHRVQLARGVFPPLTETARGHVAGVDEIRMRKHPAESRVKRLKEKSANLPETEASLQVGRG